MNCPNCQAPIDLATIPDHEFASERGRRNSFKRKKHSGGKVPRGKGKAARCPCGCGLTLARGLIRHPARIQAAAKISQNS